MTHVSYVNYAGQPVSLDSTLHAKAKPAREARSYHNGWRVVGVPPGAMEEAKLQHEADIEHAKSQKGKGSKQPKPWNEVAWLRQFKKASVRSKPYEIPEAAIVCKEMAEKSGWTYVEVVEIKKEVQAA